MDHLTAIAEYINACRHTCGDNAKIQSLVDTQIAHIKSNMKNITLTVGDAAAILRALGDDGNEVLCQAFTQTQRRALGSWIMEKSDSGESIAKPKTVTRAAQQEHFFFHNYLTATDWSVLTSSQYSIDDRLHVLSERALAIGLLNPTEKSVVAIIALMKVAGNLHLSPRQSLDHGETFKKCLKTRRPGLAQTRLKFQEDVTAFVLEHPEGYAGDIPVEPPIDVIAVGMHRRVMPSRKTHNSVANSSAISSFGNPTVNNNDAMRHGMAIMAQCMMNNRGMRTDPDIPITFLGGKAGTGRGQGAPASEHRVSPQQCRSRGSPPQSLALDDSLDQRSSPSPAATPARAIAIPIGLAGAASAESGAELAAAESWGGGDDFEGSAAERDATDSLLDNMVDEMKDSLKRKKEAAAMMKETAAAEGGDGMGRGRGRGKGHGKGRGKGRGKGKCRGKGKGEVAASAGVLPIMAGAKAKAKAKAKATACKPSVTVEWSRSQVQARTGAKGTGQSKSFKFKGEDTSSAMRQERAWLLAEHGIRI